MSRTPGNNSLFESHPARPHAEQVECNLTQIAETKNRDWLSTIPVIVFNQSLTLAAVSFSRVAGFVRIRGSHNERFRILTNPAKFNIARSKWKTANEIGSL